MSYVSEKTEINVISGIAVVLILFETEPDIYQGVDRMTTKIQISSRNLLNIHLQIRRENKNKRIQEYTPQEKRCSTFS